MRAEGRERTHDAAPARRFAGAALARAAAKFESMAIAFPEWARRVLLLIRNLQRRLTPTEWVFERLWLENSAHGSCCKPETYSVGDVFWNGRGTVRTLPPAESVFECVMH
jgi:hypothetical protein